MAARIRTRGNADPAAKSAKRCRVTGVALAPHGGGRGRPAEYVNEDARQFAFRMAQLQTLFNRVLPLMDAETVAHWKGEFWTLANTANRRMNALRKMPVAESGADADAADAPPVGVALN